MNTQSLSAPSDADLFDICKAFTGAPRKEDRMASHLNYIAEILEDCGPLPNEPVLLWREDRRVKQKPVGSDLIVGRKPGEQGLALPEDRLLSREHFAIHIVGGSHVLEDLKSRNGTVVNQPNNRIEKHLLHDGDLIFSGSQIFVFLDPRKVN
jgi:hypothetical protein